MGMGRALLALLRRCRHRGMPTACLHAPVPCAPLPPAASQLRDLPESWQHEMPNRERLLAEEQA